MWDDIIKILIYLVAGGAITFFITKYFRQKKSLAYQIVSRMSLVDVNPEVRDKIKIDYDGTRVENIFSFKVRVINDGNVPIKNQPLLFEFDKEAKILVADYKTKPEKEFGEVKRENAGALNGSKFIIGLLNPKSKREEIEFNFLTIDNKNDDITLYAKGENLRVREISSKFYKSLVVAVVPFLAVTAMVLLLLLFVSPLDRIVAYTAMAFFLVGSSWAVYNLLIEDLKGKI